MAMETPTPCPLCGYPAHPGKCPRPKKGEWWCACCLLELDVTPGVAPAILLAAGAQKTKHWCKRCGSTICPKHGLFGSNPPRCLEDCRRRDPADVEAITELIKEYNPGFLKYGPKSCYVCGVPAYRRAMCQRHYSQVRRGATELQVDRQRYLRGTENAVVPAGIKLNPATLAAAKQLAAEDNLTLSRWGAELIEAEIERRTGKPVKHAYRVWLPARAKKRGRPYHNPPPLSPRE